jgi:hypothetical protein
MHASPRLEPPPNLLKIGKTRRLRTNTQRFNRESAFLANTLNRAALSLWANLAAESDRRTEAVRRKLFVIESSIGPPASKGKTTVLYYLSNTT